MEWTEETVMRLRGLWDEGLSTAEIGRRLGMTKNAIVGKAHRLDLPARPSPIRRGSGERRPRQPRLRRTPGPTLPPLASVRQAPPTTARLAPAGHQAPQPPRLQAVPPPRYGRVITCCWPIGEPGTKSFRFCDSPSVPGKPYCGEHAALAYVKVRDRREDAA
jgi:GcrA cell cycle regulator